MPQEELEDLATQEVELESQGVGLALKRFWESWERTRLSDSKAGRSLLEIALPPLTEAVRQEQEKIKAGARPRFWQEMVSVQADRLAYITIVTILDGYRGSKEDEKLTKYTMLAKRTGEWAKLEYRVDQEPEADRVRRWVSAGHDKNPSRARKRYKPFAKRGWAGKRNAIQLGGALLALAVDHGEGLFKLYERVQQPTRIRLTLKGLRTLAECRRREENTLRPKFLPTVHPPLVWQGNEGGGYKDFALSLVKRDEDPDIQEALKKADLRVVCEAINAIQATPWRINERVFLVMAAVAEERGPVAVLPYMDIPLMPPRLPKKTTPEVEWKKRQGERYRVGRLRRLAGRNLAALDLRLSIARILGRRVFYFAHQVDLRSRAYPVPQEVHPQAEDMSRALLEFARGKPLGERGAFWLAVQLANLYGHKVDKLSLEKRFQWVKDHEEEILDSAARPLEGKMLWARAEKKWRFLAACLEWAGYVAEGPSYVSYLPIAMDGTCNGMQHLSALGRDPVGGAWTNLVPGEEPKDLYQEVANRLQPIVDEDAGKGDPMAILWKPCIKRALVKQATMTTPYGVTVSGMIDQLKGVILEDAEYRARFADETSAASYLATRVNRAIAQVAVKATAIRAWLRKLAKKMAKKDRGLSWVVPTGFPVVHEYRQEVKRRVDTVRGKVLLKEADPKLKIRTKKQGNSIVPNLIHSLDATHMMFTVCALKAAGLSDFSMVHDSYAVPASDVDLMNKVLREQFVRVHTEFTLAGFLDQIKAGAPGIRFTKKSAPPALGTLDLAGVRDSTYLFS
jgi:DNA-directed RNA polymerase